MKKIIFSKNFIRCFFFKDREFVEMGPDVLISGGGTSLIPGGSAIAGLGRFSSPTSNFLLNRRRWWCCGVPRRKKSSYKASTVSFNCKNRFYYFCFRLITYKPNFSTESKVK
jgi:hypothetical protein